MVASVIAETNRNPKKRNRPFTPADFMPKRRRGAQTPEQQAALLRALTVALGGEVRVRGR